jgi:hypothetical protein
MKNATIVLALMLGLAAPARAQLTFEVLDLSQSTVRRTYTRTTTRAGATSDSIGPIADAAGSLAVVSCREKNTQQSCEAEGFNDSRRGAWIRYRFPNPVPSGGSFTVDVAFDYRSTGISRDQDGRFAFEFSTGQEAFFVLPLGHALVYSNFPVLIYERDRSTVAQVKPSGGNRGLMFKTRSFTR